MRDQQVHYRYETMNKSAFSLRIFSIYMLALGAMLVVSPNFLLHFFGFPETRDVWIHVVGMLVLIIGYFYFMASLNELSVFARWSVYARLSVLVFFMAFVALGFAPPVLILFGAIDAAAAIWTAVCLRADGLAQQVAQGDTEKRRA